MGLEGYMVETNRTVKRLKEKFSFRFAETSGRDFRASSLRAAEESFEDENAGIPTDLALAGLSEADIVKAGECHQSFLDFPKK